MGSYIHCAVKTHDGPPLFARDVYDEHGMTDRHYPQLLINIQKAFPTLTLAEVSDCIKFCQKDESIDIIQECQEFMLWKIIHQENIDPKRKSCFKEYRKQR